jgi:mannose-6-phosphate isomerase-like protein (cupin superfamily)
VPEETTRDTSRTGERPIATRVVFEDDAVRVWDQVIGAGETLERHTHENDYVLITIAGEGPIEVHFHDGTGGPLGDELTLRTKRGDATFVPKGHTETAENRGEDYRAILVELKR